MNISRKGKNNLTKKRSYQTFVKLRLLLLQIESTVLIYINIKVQLYRLLIINLKRINHPFKS